MGGGGVSKEGKGGREKREKGERQEGLGRDGRGGAVKSTHTRTGAKTNTPLPHTLAHMHTHTCIHTHAQAQTHVCTHEHTHTHARTHIYIHTYTQTHTQHPCARTSESRSSHTRKLPKSKQHPCFRLSDQPPPTPPPQPTPGSAGSSPPQLRPHRCAHAPHGMVQSMPCSKPFHGPKHAMVQRMPWSITRRGAPEGLLGHVDAGHPEPPTHTQTPQMHTAKHAMAHPRAFSATSTRAIRR